MFSSLPHQGNLIYFLHVPLFCGRAGIFELLSWINRNHDWVKTLWFKKVGGKGLWGKNFLEGGETPKDTMRRKPIAKTCSKVISKAIIKTNEANSISVV